MIDSTQELKTTEDQFEMCEEKIEWQKPDVIVVDISEQTQNNFNGAGSDGKFFS